MSVCVGGVHVYIGVSVSVCMCVCVSVCMCVHVFPMGHGTLCEDVNIVTVHLSA